MRPKSERSGTVQPDSGELRPSRRCRRASARNPVGCRIRFQDENSASRLERRRVNRSVSTVGRPTGRTIHSRHYGVGGDQVSTGRRSRFRARSARSRVSADPALQPADAASLAAPDLASGDGPQGVVVDRFEGVRRGWQGKKLTGTGDCLTAPSSLPPPNSYATAFSTFIRP